MKDIPLKIKKIIKDTIGEEDIDIKSESLLMELGINSLSFIKIIVSIESEFKIEFNDEYLNNEIVSTFENLVQLVEGLINNKN